MQCAFTIQLLIRQNHTRSADKLEHKILQTIPSLSGTIVLATCVNARCIVTSLRDWQIVDVPELKVILPLVLLLGRDNLEVTCHQRRYVLLGQSATAFLGNFGPSTTGGLIFGRRR